MNETGDRCGPAVQAAQLGGGLTMNAKRRMIWTFVVTSATLDHVSIAGVSTPFYYEADFGMPAPTIGGTYTVL